RRSLPKWTFTAAVIAFIALYFLTVVESTADTPVYVAHIEEYNEHGSPTSIWEFGHLLWRPVGYALWRALHPALATWSQGNAWMEITAILLAVNFLVGIGLVITLLLVCNRLGLSAGMSSAVTAGFMLCATVLKYVHSGMSYNLGLLFQLA